MRNVIRFVFAGVIFTLLFQSYSCKKDALSKYDKAIVNTKIFDDDSIALPVAVAAGSNCLLCAYNTSSGDLKFNLSDNEGNLIWQKQFGFNSIAKILYENDGTFTIFPGGPRLINIDKNGNVLRDDPAFMDSLWGYNVIFNAFLDRNNNYVIMGMFGASTQFGVNRAYATAYTHDGDFIFQKNYIDTNWVPNTVVIGNYSTITGCEFMDDGGYLFFGSAYYAAFHDMRNQLRYDLIRTDHLGNIIWQKNNLLLDSAQIGPVNGEPPFSNQLPYNLDVYGFHPESFTHEIIKTGDGNYLCFLNIPDYMASDQSARVYKIDPDGNTLDSASIDFGKYNRYIGGLSIYFKSGSDKSYTCGNSVVRNAGNTFSICMQNGFFGAKGLTNSYLGESRSFVVHIDQDLNILDSRYFQNYYTDCFTSACKSSDGRTVYFGLISSFGNSYKPAFVFSNDN